MTLIKSISGIRGTIGGPVGENFTPIDIVECTAAFGQWTLDRTGIQRVVVGRDARISGKMVQELVVQTLIALGIEVIDLDLSTTPTVEMAVTDEKAGAGIILTASHNPAQWNALKFLNEKGEFISAADGAEVLEYIASRKMDFVSVDALGTRINKIDAIEKHITAILSLPLIPVAEIKKRNFKVVLDPVNSTGSLALPPLLEKLGCNVQLIHGEPTGHFAHNPEPLPHHLKDLSRAVVENQATVSMICRIYFCELTARRSMPDVIRACRRPALVDNPLCVNQDGQMASGVLSVDFEGAQSISVEDLCRGAGVDPVFTTLNMGPTSAGTCLSVMP